MRSEGETIYDKAGGTGRKPLHTVLESGDVILSAKENTEEERHDLFSKSSPLHSADGVVE